MLDNRARHRHGSGAATWNQRLPNLGAGLGPLEQGTPAYFCGGEIVAALKAYRAASPGTVKDFPLELADLARDPRMLAEVSYLSVLPVDPTKSRLGRDTQRKKAGGRRA